MDGHIKKIVAERGFGFIAADDGKDYFFHRDDLRSGGLGFTELQPGNSVSFEPQQGLKGPRAVDVRPT